MIRLYIPKDFILSSPQIGSIISLLPEQSHYLGAVMRLSVGDEILVFNEVIGEWLVRIDQIKKQKCQCVLSKQIRSPLGAQVNGDQKKEIHLFFAPLKHTQTHFVIEKGTELGVTHFHPVRTTRSNASGVRVDKLLKNAIEAAEQCERLDCPVIYDLISLPQALETWNNQFTLVAAIERKDHLPTLLEGLGKPLPLKVGFFVGPEGGITPEEVQLLTHYEAVKLVHLGPRILRAETASLSLLSGYQTLLGNAGY